MSKSNPILKIRTFEELNNKELYNIITLRETVFVVEQNCPYLDCDGKDFESLHMGIYAEDKLQAYVRLVPPGLSYDSWSIGRVVVSPEFRGLGLGKMVMQEAIEYLKNEKKAEKITISAQEYLLRFYNELGFHQVGEGYLEDDIPHVKMVWRNVK
jgi:ElaA protein